VAFRSSDFIHVFRAHACTCETFPSKSSVSVATLIAFFSVTNLPSINDLPHTNTWASLSHFIRFFQYIYNQFLHYVPFSLTCSVNTSASNSLRRPRKRRKSSFVTKPPRSKPRPLTMLMSIRYKKINNSFRPSLLVDSYSLLSFFFYVSAADRRRASIWRATSRIWRQIDRPKSSAKYDHF
jgi:hypothetical protein